jgi:tRNA dimethylallyltransferase
MLDLNNIIAKNNTSVPKLIVVCGPTATGKSGLAIALAQRLNAAILSADSRQVYREFNIGTAKPSQAEQQTVPHYLIDICDPTETLTVAEYQQQAQGLIWGVGCRVSGVGCQERGGGEERDTEIQGRGHAGTSNQIQNSQFTIHNSKSSFPTSDPQTTLLVGGTGLYLKSIVKGMKIPSVPPQKELRSQLQSLGQSQCYGMLQQVDPTSAKKIHPNDQVRTLRSLEVFYVTGRPMSAQQGEDPPTYPILQIGLDCADADTLKRRIEMRTGQMLEAGLAQEVESLCCKYGVDLPLLNTLGYAEFKQYLAGKISLAEAADLTVLHTRQFAKRQRTWFRGCPEIEWFDADHSQLLEQVWRRVQSFLRGSESV